MKYKSEFKPMHLIQSYIYCWWNYNGVKYIGAWIMTIEWLSLEI